MTFADLSMTDWSLLISTLSVVILLLNLVLL